MNRMKRSCALLLAIVLILGAAFPLGIGGVVAENTEQTEQIAEPAMQPAAEPDGEPAMQPAAEPDGEPATEAFTEPVGEVFTEPATEADGEPVTEIFTDSAAEADGEPTTEIFTDSAAEADGEPTTEPEGETGTNEELLVLSFYEQLMACGSLAEFDVLMRAEENTAEPDTVTQEEWKQLLVRVEEIYAGIEEPAEADTLLKEELLEKLNEHIIVICPECGEADGHVETCSQYVEEFVGYLWADLTDPELAAWLMEEANADIVKAILTGDSEESAALNLRIEAILNGEDTELARQLKEYLSALLELDVQVFTDGTEFTDGPQDEYIYFDLAAGDVNIGESGYSGFVYVNGTKTDVKGPHATDNKYYVYQSTNANRETTGYAKKTEFDAKTGCRVPEYTRVQNGAWGGYVTNNTDVYGVSNAWENEAKNVGRTGTANRITFKSESNYTANVTIDNIWSTYHQGKNKRSTGGIGANLKNGGTDYKNTHIQLKLKGDNRVGCIHYCANEGAGDTIEFNNGEIGDTPGSITVADFPSNFSANYWSSAIGAADDPPGTGDFADGIVIRSGVIYAGTTSADDSTAIGGGGNNYGGVTINGGTVTAVTASTGTAIGGGIGWGSKGGDAKVTITGGTVYAYNHGIGPDSGSYTSFVPAVAIGGGSADRNTGNDRTTVTISGGTVYAQSVGGAAIGGGGSGTNKGGDANVTISGGTVIAKSVGGTVRYNKEGNTNHTEEVPVGVSIGGGTGKTGGGSVTLNVSDGTLRTGSIGGGKSTGLGRIGSANVTITGGDITGQVIMAEGANKACTFDMSGGRIHDTDVISGNTVTDKGFTDPQPSVRIRYIQENGGAVWMEDPNGKTNVSGGIIENCTAKLGGAIYMNGGTFTLSDTGTIRGNTAQRFEEDTENTGRGGGVYIDNGNVYVSNGSISNNIAGVRGGGFYVNGGSVHVSGGSINENKADGRGGGVYLTGGSFTMDDGTISGNTAGIRGGGIFLTQTPILTKGVISGNTAEDYGGGLCINGDKLELTSPAMQIFGNTAKNGGGVAVLNGDFILNGGAVGVNGQEANIAKEKGGGVYVEADSTVAGATASATVKSGNIWYNEAKEGGGIYLAKGNGDFTLDGKDASVSHNKAISGGGIYLYKDPLLNQGRIEQNTATGNGGGMYISDCIVTLNSTSDVTVTQNTAQNGAGIYIHGSSESSKSSGGSGSAVDAVSSASVIPAQSVGLLVGSDITGTVKFTNNVALKSGGAVCVTAGYFYLESDKITVTGNKAVNGGGVAVLQGNFTMTNGSIGEENGANTATNGGGVYVSDGEVWLKGGSVKYNKATDGGGAYVTGGRIVMIEGSLANNEAERNGGGGYVAGNFRMLGGSVGGNRATYGGGVYVSEGNVYVIYGEISHNYASQDGGGFHVSAIDQTVEVKMLSGSLSYNQAVNGGGGMAVESTNNTKITVEIGCLLNHYKADDSGELSLPIDYTGEKYQDYATFDKIEYQHNSCPKVKYNQAGSIGGGFYLNSQASTVSFYCVEETQNTAQGKDSAGMDVVGGTVIIGDSDYHNHEHDQGSEGRNWGRPRGYVSMDNATLVNGGKVDIYGDMINPVFRDEVTVAIVDKENDYFMDHRRSKDGKRYKVHYFENFSGAGLYQAMQYNEGHTEITIEGALYKRPGYRILGWCTQPIRVEGAPDNYYYEVGKKIDLADHASVPGLGIHPTHCEICGESSDLTLLELYAIWEANGYTVEFNPNVPMGDTFTGTMQDQIYNYDQPQKLRLNAYKYPGHFFTGWNTKTDNTGDPYTDGQEVSNLTNQNGVTVVLYAQWERCDHKDPHRWTYDVIDGGKTLRRICSCGGQTLTATLYAENTVYNGHTHLATLTLDDQEAWGNDAPTIIYSGEWLEDELVHNDTSPELSSNGEPFHAGEYTASITKPDGNVEGAATASVKYIIEKADQSAPEKPTYTVTGNQLTVNKVQDDPRTFKDDANYPHTARAQYRLTYDSGGTPWQTMDGSDMLDITMTDAWTSYNVEARYEELDDYNASDVTRADAEYHYVGNVTVKIICDEGINYCFEASLTSEQKFNGAELTLSPKDGYYIVGGKYSVKMQLNTDPEKEVQPGANDVYSFDSIPDESTLTITIGTARKHPEIARQVEPRQVFRSLTGDSATISRDSAFTAAFQIGNFDPYYEKDGTSYGAYKEPKLTFDFQIPKDTTVILLDRGKNGAKTYWYYRAENEVNSVELTAFRKMGGNQNEKYSIPKPEADNGYIDLSYQFIVDFSQSESGYSGESLKLTLEAEVKDADTQAPTINPEVTAFMKTSSFNLKKTTEADSLTNSFTCTFDVDGKAAASKWENRASALVLKPKEGVVLPPDARIKAEVDGGTTYLYKNKTGNSFIVPLFLLRTEEKTVKLTLQSVLFPPKETKSYAFTAEWLISPSKASKAPMSGDQADEPPLDVTFTSAAKVAPSLKSTGQQRVLTIQDTLELGIKMKNMTGYTVSADILRKSEEDGIYRETGWNKQITIGPEGSLSVPLGGQTPGSFCLMLTVKQENSITIVMEVPYYFIIK